MKFISVRRLAAALKLEFFRIDDEFIERLRKTIDQYFQESEFFTAFGQVFNQNELVFVLNQLKDEANRVFHDWIEEDHVLAEYLFSRGEVITPNEEIVLSKEDELFSAYQDFLSDYLAPILEKKTALAIKSGDLEELGNHLKFSPLLPEEKRIEIQQAVSKYLGQLLAQLKVSQGVDLQNQLKTIFSYEFVNVLNELDKYFYKDSIIYFDTARLIVQKIDLSPLILDEIKTTLSSLKLNKEDHQNAINFIKSDVFSARIKEPRSTINEMVRSPFFFVAVAVVLINFIYFYPRKNENAKEVVKENVIEDSAMNISFPVLIDTFHFDASYRILDEKSFSNYRPLYFGKKSDTLYVDYNLVSYAFGEASGIEVVEVLEDKEAMRKNKIKADLFNKKRESYSEYYRDLNFNFHSIPPTWEDAKIKITIDTSQLIRNIGSTKYEINEFVYNAYPVILENLSDTEILIGYGSQIPLILEVKDKNGVWKAVEFQYSYPCGNGLPSIALPKNEIVLTSVAVVEFDVKKKLRLRIGENYSEVFRGGKRGVDR